MQTMTADHQIREKEQIMNHIDKIKILRPFTKNGDTKCAKCGTWCQGIKASDGRIYCVDCYNKYIK